MSPHMPVFMLGLALGVTFGLWVGALLTAALLDGFTRTKFSKSSPTTGEYVMPTNRQERSRYD